MIFFKCRKHLSGDVWDSSIITNTYQKIEPLFRISSEVHISNLTDNHHYSVSIMSNANVTTNEDTFFLHLNIRYVNPDMMLSLFLRKFKSTTVTFFHLRRFHSLNVTVRSFVWHYELFDRAVPAWHADVTHVMLQVVARPGSSFAAQRYRIPRFVQTSFKSSW